MIAHITGTIRDKNERFVIVETGGLGYKVFMSADTIGELSIGQQVSLYTYLAVREDALDLYGFATEEHQIFFEMLLSVSGIGPRSALSILSLATIDVLKKAIAQVK